MLTLRSRWLLPLMLMQCGGYWLLWLMLHSTATQMVVPSGWFDPASHFGRTIVGQLPKVVMTRTGVTGLGVAVAFGLACLGYLGVVFGGLRWHLSLGRILGITSLLMVPLFLLPRLFSSDVYSYAMFGRITWVYGRNALIDVPANFPDDPLLPFVAWKTTASVYGPAWLLISWPITLLAQAIGGVGSFVILYKLLAIGCHLVNIYLVWRLLGRFWPDRMAWGTLVYGWNPLVLIEFAGSGHNDVVMLTLILVAATAIAGERFRQATVWLVLAALVKLVAALLLPIYGLYLFRRSSQQLRLVVEHIGLALATVVALYLPFWRGPETLRILVTAPPLTIIHNSPASWLFTKSERWACPTLTAACEQAWNGQVRLICMVIFLLAYVALLSRIPRAPGQLFDRWSLALVLYGAVVAVHFEPWYGTWPLAIVPLASQPRRLLAVWGCILLVFYLSLPIPGRIVVAFLPLVLLGLSDVWRLISRVRNRARLTLEQK